MFKGLTSLLIAGPLLFAALPATTNYSLQSFGFGSGGTANSSTSNYSLEGISGEVSGTSPATATYTTKPGFIQTEQANVPQITLTNPSSFYDKLHFVLDAQNNPTDALFEMQVCVGGTGFSGATCAGGGTLKYLKNDDTLGASLSLADYQTYSAWGGASGQNMIGLSPSTTYYIQALATQGQFTESGYGPSSNAATSGQSISFCLYTGASCGLGSNTIAFGTININSVNTSSNIGTDLTTNADNGGSVYIYSKNGGMKSTSNGYTINSPAGQTNLAAVSEDYGAQITSVGQTSGGPLAKVTPYDGTANVVGGLTTSINTLLTTTAPITGGTAATQLQIKPSYSAVPKTDYTETLTLIAAGNW